MVCRGLLGFACARICDNYKMNDFIMQGTQTQNNYFDIVNIILICLLDLSVLYATMLQTIVSVIYINTMYHMCYVYKIVGLLLYYCIQALTRSACVDLEKCWAKI